jgi:HPr kinase/phosphorylase
MLLQNLKEVTRKNITVGFLFESCKDKFKLIAMHENVGLDKLITDRNINRPGLALAGYVELFTYNRVQVFGNTEIRYLNSLSFKERVKAFKTLCQFKIPAIVITNNNQLESELIEIAKKADIPIFYSSISTTKFIYFLSDFLDDQFAPQTLIHGAFIDVYGIGMLVIGRSGIGKSEIALDLVERGHRLVADDVVIVTRKGEGILIGSGNELVQHYMEIRGLGLVDVRNIFGVRSIRFQKRVEVIVELEEWKPDVEYNRTGLDQETVPILGVDTLRVKLPIFPGKNITVITEVIALNYLMKHYGVDSAQEFSKRLSEAIKTKDKSLGKRIISYFEHDFE